MNTFHLTMIAVVGLMISIIGMARTSGELSRAVPWGLAICVAALTQGLRLLQKQIDALKTGAQRPEVEGQQKE